MLFRSAMTLLDELKQKVLQLSDRIVEEVDGATTRFLLHEELLAAVTREAGGLVARVGEAQEAPRPLADRGGLNAVVDEIVRRYFGLVRHRRTTARVASETADPS